MDQITPAQAHQVWQRVRGGNEQDDPLPRLLALEAQMQHIYHYLRRNTPLRDSRLLSRLLEDSRRFAAVLAGVCVQLELDHTIQAPPSVRGNCTGLLRLCFQTRMESLSLLDRLPKAVAAATGILRHQMENHTLTLLELLGQIREK